MRAVSGSLSQVSTALTGFARVVHWAVGWYGVCGVVEIRTFTESDRAELRELFGRAGEGSPTASLWGHLESEAAVYLDPYIELAPDSLFIAVLDGVLVGYLTGCLDSSAFPSESERMDKAIRRHRLILRAKPAAFFARSLADLARSALRREGSAGELVDARWPAHLHMNVLPVARGTGVAESLMIRWLERVAATGTAGCHLQTLCENVRAVRFFERMGFTRYGPTPLVPGIRQHGKRLHQQTMVWAP